MNKLRQVCLHSAVWVLILLFFLIWGSKGFDIKYHLFVAIVYFGIINIIVFYINYLYLLPRFLTRKRYFEYVFTILFLLAASAFVKYGMALHFGEVILHRHAKSGSPLSFQEYYSAALAVSAFFVFLSAGVRFAVDWFSNEKLRKDLENEKLAAELAFLRSQINPHFLFNSLNNIYSLAYQKSEKAPEAILKLSGIMRYMLNESNEHVVAISEEIGYLKNYIQLQKLRFKDGGSLEFDLQGEDYSRQKIAPFVLIALVENAFKHGDCSDAENPVKICCTISPGTLLFKVSNKISEFSKDREPGTGLNNLKRRLDLLYRDKYSLEIVNNGSIYYCELSLVL